jgi:hypothetical protein
MPTPDLDLKVRRLDNDVHAIYAMLGDISTGQKRQDQRLEDIFRRQIEFHITQQCQGSRLEEIATEQASLASAQAALATGQAALATGQAALHATQDRQGGRLEEIAKEQAAHREKLDEILKVLRNGHPAGRG